MTWCLWSCPEPEQSWAFPKRLGLFQRGLITIYYHFQKLIESPTTVRQKAERDIPAPGTTSRGRAALQVPFSSVRLWRGHIGPPGAAHVRKSCLARFSLVPWPCHGLGASRRLPTENYMLDSRKNNFAFKHNSKCMSLLKVLMGKWSFMKW